MHHHALISGFLLLALNFSSPASAVEVLNSGGSHNQTMSSRTVPEEPPAIEKIFRNSANFSHLARPGKIMPGAAISNSVSGQVCSAGWFFQRGGEMFLSTAGHCGKPGDVFTVLAPNGARTPIGKIVRSDYNSFDDLGVNDFALLTIDNTSLIESFVPLNGDYLSPHFSYFSPHKSLGKHITDATICGLGFRSGISCGPFERLGSRGEIYFRRISDYGDSCGPIFAVKDNNIYPLGIGSAGNDYDATLSLAQPLLSKMRAYDLQIVLSFEDVQ